MDRIQLGEQWKGTTGGVALEHKEDGDLLVGKYMSRKTLWVTLLYKLPEKNIVDFDNDVESYLIEGDIWGL